MTAAEREALTAWHRQYFRAHGQGWLPFFIKAALEHQVRPEVLLAIASRETDMGGRELSTNVFEWLTKPGDSGHGFGLLQIDGRFLPEWAASGAWRQAEAGIHAGAEVLAGKRAGLQRRAGQIITVRDSSTKLTYRYRLQAFTGDALERVSIAAYNCGDWAGYHVRKGRDVDHGTTHRNYSRDVLTRATAFRQWLTADRWLQK